MTGMGVDAGLHYSFKNFSLGATMQNLTVSKMKFINSEYLLPQTLRGGYTFQDTDLTSRGAGFGVIIPMNWFCRSITELDYAYQLMDEFITQAHYFSLSSNLGKTQAVGPIADVDPEEFKADCGNLGRQDRDSTLRKRQCVDDLAHQFRF